jgi:adenine-specific DNA-methyltransferase
MMQDRYLKSISLLNNKGSFLCHIDEYEIERLHLLLESGSTEDAGTLIWDKGAPVTGSTGLATQHEYVLWRTLGRTSVRSRKRNVNEIGQKIRDLIKEFGGANEEAIRNYRKWLRNNEALSKAERTYDWFDQEGRAYRSDNMSATDRRKDEKFYEPLIHPITKQPCPIPDFGWRYTPQTISVLLKEGVILFGNDHTTMPRRKTFLADNEDNQVSSIFKSGAKGKVELDRLNLEFAFAHPTEFYKYLLEAATTDSADIILDFFAGSGTTGHSIIDLNREDQASRKYILIEVGEHFNTALKPRIQKVIYSKDWRDGKPVSREGSSHLFKYIHLESYEDALNNLELNRTAEQASLLEMHDEFREDYMLRYMLDVEARGSAGLLNIENFADPFNYQLNIATGGSVGETRPVTVDLVETFNYLLGLSVKHVDAIRGFRIIEGTNPEGEKVLVIWRNTREKSNDSLDQFFQRQGYNTRDRKFDLIYINGDNNLENLKRADETWKVRLIEEEFQRLMFDVQDV